VQLDPIRPKLTAPGTKCSKLKYDKLLSRFAFKFDLRRCTKEKLEDAKKDVEVAEKDLGDANAAAQAATAAAEAKVGTLLSCKLPSSPNVLLMVRINQPSPPFQTLCFKLSLSPNALHMAGKSPTLSAFSSARTLQYVRAKAVSRSTILRIFCPPRRRALQSGPLPATP